MSERAHSREAWEEAAERVRLLHRLASRVSGNELGILSADDVLGVTLRIYQYANVLQAGRLRVERFAGWVLGEAAPQFDARFSGELSTEELTVRDLARAVALAEEVADGFRARSPTQIYETLGKIMLFAVRLPDLEESAAASPFSELSTREIASTLMTTANEFKRGNLTKANLTDRLKQILYAAHRTDAGAIFLFTYATFLAARSLSQYLDTDDKAGFFDVLPSVIAEFSVALTQRDEVAQYAACMRAVGLAQTQYDEVDPEPVIKDVRGIGRSSDPTGFRRVLQPAFR